MARNQQKIREGFDSVQFLNETIARLEKEGKERAIRKQVEYKESSGIIGEAFEITVRQYLQPTSTRNNGYVTERNTWYGDLRIGRNTKVEVKSACGELGVGYSFEDILPKADYVIYCPEVTRSIPIEKQAFIFKRSEFIDMLQSYPGSGSLVRFGKIKTSEGLHGSDTEEVRKARGSVIAIQSFYSEGRQKASRKLAEYLWGSCYAQMTLSEWIKEIEEERKGGSEK